MTGSETWCPVCNAVNRLYFPLPDYYREQADKYGFVHKEGEMTSVDTYSCSVCGASDRERLYALYLRLLEMVLQEGKTEGLSPKPELMIHFAPEPALSGHIREKGYFLRYETADLMMQDVVHQNVDLQSLPFDDDICDFFICSHVLEHVADDRKAIRELYRITRPGGGGLLMAPICMSIDETLEDPSITDEGERWRLFGQNDHVRLYNHDDYVSRIREGGFSLSQMTQDDFGEAMFRKLGLKPSSILYVVSKA
jgi:SAM-dependent methyltransferase